MNLNTEIDIENIIYFSCKLTSVFLCTCDQSVSVSHSV